MAKVGYPGSSTGGDAGGTGGGGGGAAVAQSDGESLARFVEDLQKFMREVVDSPLIPEELQALYGQALDGLEGDFQLVTAQLRQPAIADHLLRADLTGVPRRLKQGLYDAGRAIADQPRRAARVAFKAANIILGSLSFVPGVEPIKEIKEAIEVGIDLTERHPQA